MVSYVSYHAGITLAESAGNGAVCPRKAHFPQKFAKNMPTVTGKPQPPKKLQS